LQNFSPEVNTIIKFLGSGVKVFMNQTLTVAVGSLALLFVFGGSRFQTRMAFRSFIRCLQAYSLIVSQTTPHAFQLTTPCSPEYSTILSNLVVSSLIIYK